MAGAPPPRLLLYENDDEGPLPPQDQLIAAAALLLQAVRHPQIALLPQHGELFAAANMLFAAVGQPVFAGQVVAAQQGDVIPALEQNGADRARQQLPRRGAVPRGQPVNAVDQVGARRLAQQIVHAPPAPRGFRIIRLPQAPAGVQPPAQIDAVAPPAQVDAVAPPAQVDAVAPPPDAGNAVFVPHLPPLQLEPSLQGLRFDRLQRNVVVQRVDDNDTCFIMNVHRLRGNERTCRCIGCITAYNQGTISK